MINLLYLHYQITPKQWSGGGSKTKHIIMGLDMYLYRVPKVASLDELQKINSRLDKAYIDNNMQNELKAIAKEYDYIYDIDFAINRYVDIDKYKADPKGWGNLIDLTIRVAYWRKFNALHAWFVANVQDDEDNCGAYIVTIDHLKKLQKDLSELTPETASTILPTQVGFFFGGVDYDEYYWQDVERLKHEVVFLISQQPHDTVYTYSSSW